MNRCYLLTALFLFILGTSLSGCEGYHRDAWSEHYNTVDLIYDNTKPLGK